MRSNAGSARRYSRPALFFLAAALLGAAAPAPALAQRQPVLKQIKVPHSYYYREMYLPQATSGPSAADWSPDGRDIVYSMQGSLWRQTVGAPIAQQITAGPGYDFQPDWSPDGRFIAYASYRDDAVELWLLNLATGESAPLTRNGAANLEPRFSPDGGRLAFVSTLYRQRFHIFVLRLDGKGRDPERLTPDHKSDLPRYYYAAHDHYLSPSWSPDGSEILFVSNRGRIWGSGGVWRMRSEPDAHAREIHHEESTWKARPDWSPDGRRVLYASYLGRQWHQIWIMTDEGGDPFPLTYGDFDAVAPRWSPDGRRIAYVSNEAGDTSLWIQEIPGGRRRPVEIRERRYREPMGRLRLRIVDKASGRAVPARVSVEGPDGRYFAPDDAWRHADDAFDRGERRFEYSYFHTTGASELMAPAGRVRVEITRGPEYRVFRREVALEKGEARTLEASLERIADMRARGWWSGDLHVHMNYGGAYRNDPKRLASMARSEDLHLVENLIVNKEQRVPDIGYFTGKPDPASTDDLLILHDQEFHTSFWGHTGLLGLTENILIPDYAAYVNTAAASLHPPNAVVADLARAQGAVLGYVHPFDREPDPYNPDAPLTHEIPVGAALGKVDYYEAVGFNEDPFATQNVWYRLLNCGFRIPAGAGTDAMANYASLRGPVGINRVYVKLGPRLEYRAFLEGLKAGRTLATNGPLLEFSLGGKEAGAEVRLPAGTHSLEARVTLRSFVPLDHLEIVGNGRVVAELPLSGEGATATATRKIAVERSGWYVARAWSSRAAHPVLDFLPFGTTSPVYVTVGDAPVRSPEDAAYFIAWIDRLVHAARVHPGYNTAAEREEILRLLTDARAVYVERSRPLP